MEFNEHSVIRIVVFDELINQAKEITKQFDAQKDYEKFECSNNWYGILGELIFKNYLEENKIPFNHIDFVKKGWEDPDFIINGKKIDVKTTKDYNLFIPENQKSGKYDYYVLITFCEETNTAYIQGYITDKKAISTKLKCEHHGKTYKIIGLERLKPIKEFTEELCST